MRMQNTILSFPDATCMLVEVIARNSQNIVWNVSLDGDSVSNQRIRPWLSCIFLSHFGFISGCHGKADRVFGLVMTVFHPSGDKRQIINIFFSVK